MFKDFRACLSALAIVCVGLSGCSENSEGGAALPRFEATGELPSGVLNRKSLIEFAFAANQYEPADEFSPQDFADSQIEGRKFTVELDASDPTTGVGKLYNYDEKEQKLTFSSFPSQKNIFLERTLLPSEERSNAFGAEVIVDRSLTKAVSIGPIEERSGFFRDRTEKPIEYGVYKLNEEYDSTFDQVKYDYEELEKVLAVSPGQAREMTKDLRLIVEGVVTKSFRGNSVQCSVDGSRATLQAPTESIIERCEISARFTRIEIRSASKGTIAVWQ